MSVFIYLLFGFSIELFMSSMELCSTTLLKWEVGIVNVCFVSTMFLCLCPSFSRPYFILFFIITDRILSISTSMFCFCVNNFQKLNECDVRKPKIYLS